MFVKRMVMADAAAAAGSTTSTGAGEGSGGAAAGSWYASLPTEEKGFVETKGYKDMADMVKSHRNLETLLGVPKERLLKLPEKADDKEWGNVWQKLGKPEKPDGYDPKSFGKGVSETDAKWLQDTFHNLNLTKAQGETLAAKWQEKMGTLQTSLQESQLNASNQQLEKLKQEWGAAFEEKSKIANQIASQVGITDAQYEQGESAMGVDGWAKFLEGIATKFDIKFNEAGFHRGDGGGGTGAMTPAMAQERLNRLQNDQEWIKRFMNGGADERQEMDNLHKAMYPGMTEV